LVVDVDALLSAELELDELELELDEHPAIASTQSAATAAVATTFKNFLFINPLQKRIETDTSLQYRSTALKRK
jgi:hypothetical protein